MQQHTNAFAPKEWPPKEVVCREPGYETSTVKKWDESMRRQKLRAKRLKAKRNQRLARRRNRCR